MLKFFPYVLKTLLGHRVRTLLTISAVALAAALFLGLAACSSLRRPGPVADVRVGSGCLLAVIPALIVGFYALYLA